MIFSIWLLVIGCTLNIIIATDDLPRPNVDCSRIIVKAEARTKYVTTPGFPKPFPGDAKCLWVIIAEEKKRIRLEFQRFDLLQPITGKCEYHYVIIKSPFSLNTMGPFCGETGLPTIVSTGNLIYVELHSPKTVTTDNYKGFKLAFKETVESSSYELRPDNSVDDPIATIDPETMNILSPTPPAPKPSKVVRTTTKPWRFRPGRRPLNPTRISNHNWPGLPRRNRPTLPPRRTPTGNRRLFPPATVINIGRPRGDVPKNQSNTMKIEVIVAIAVGGLVLIAIIVAIALRLSKNRKKETNKSSASIEAVVNQTKPEKSDKQLPDVSMYPSMDPHYYYYGYDPESYAMSHVRGYCQNPTTRISASSSSKRPRKSRSHRQRSDKRRRKTR